MRDVSNLIAWVYNHPGWTLTGGELLRPQQMADLYAQSGIGVKNSLHVRRLAIDLMLFIDGQYLTHVADYAPLGDYWESLNVQNIWGGRWENGDANHFQRTPIA